MVAAPMCAMIGLSAGCATSPPATASVEVLVTPECAMCWRDGDSAGERGGVPPEAVMAELRRGPGGAPMQHDLRAMLDGIGYVTRYGIEWRAMPVDLPPWPAVYAFFGRWSDGGSPRSVDTGCYAACVTV
jgi:hypothetical protein